MRRAVSSVTVALSLLGAIVACPGAATAAQAAPAPKKRCTVEDPRLDELSGLVATKTGYIVINDGSLQENRKRVFYLDTKCRIAKEPVRYSGAGPFDTEDLAVSPDGKTLWIADIGDNPGKERRSRIAVWTMPIGGGKQPVLHRLTYPEQKPHDAEALLVGADNLPLVITKVPSGKAEIYTPTAKLKSSGDTVPVPMKKVGEIALPETSTDNPLNIFGRVAITGAARSPDGAKVVLRTYADAFEYDVTGDDIVGALTTGKPRVTPLADPFGEAISYSPDGKTFLTVSDAGELAADDPIDILAYTPSTSGAEALAGADDAKKPAAEKSWFDTLSLDQITYLIAAVGVLGALLVGAGIVGILRSRRRPAPVDTGRAADDPERDDPFPSGAVDRGDDGAGGARGGVYGGVPAGGGVYGAPPAAGAPARPPAGGAVYGGARPGGAAPGGGAPGGRPGGGVYGGARPAGGAVYGGTPGGPPPGGGAPRGGVPAGPPGVAPRGGGPAAPPAGPRGAAPNGAAPRGGGVYGGGGRAEPPRREPGPRDPRSAHRRDEGYDDRHGYGQPPGREHRGERY
ncbi:hypothetical protein [Micromonospora halophytica]|uniref:WD40-like Beta Propeller Repeat n=1 Tax=Micromonospora halophytica TaxID=47864 RepID=A0A1C5I1Y9_9ACTN|nr:hypothetical protein [Micromonospora halophytica]SCG52273.1 hypothetical protein GA0070560_107142 [Micromonospora halophytica]